MVLSDQQLLDALSRTPFTDSVELALILGEPHTTVHRVPTSLLTEGSAGRVSHGTAHLPSSQRKVRRWAAGIYRRSVSQTGCG